MGYYDNTGTWREGNPPPARARPIPRQLRPAEQRQHDPNPGVRQQARTQLRQGSYDSDGNWVEGAPANTMETLDDVRRSFGTGVEEGVSGLVQLPRMAADANDFAAEWIVDSIAGLTGGELTPEQRRTAIRFMRTPFDAATPAAQIARLGPSTEEIDQGIDDLIPGDRHTPETTAGEYARTTGRWTPQVLFPGGAATRIARTVVPAVAEEAAGQATEGTELEPYARMVAGLVGAGVNEGLIATLRRQGLSADERALRLMLRELQDQGMSTDEIVRQANILTRQAPTEEVVAEVLGEGGLRMARAVAAMGRGSGRQIADEALTARAEGGTRPAPTERRPNATREVTSIRDRVMDEASAMTAPQQNRSPRDYWDALDALRQARSGQGTEAYRAMYAQAPSEAAVQQQILPALADGPAEAAASGARQLASDANGLRFQLAAARARQAAPEVLQGLERELDDVVRSQRQLEGVAEGRMPNTMSSRAIDYYQRGIAQMERAAGAGSPEARALGNARRAFNEMADEVVPGFRDARTRYGESMRIEERMAEGRRVFEMSDGEIERAMRGAGGQGLTMEEFDGFMLGVLDAIERKLGQGDTAFLARLMRNENWRNQLTRAVGGESNARRFFDRLAREASMQQTRNFVQSGSRTQPLSEDIAALTTGEQELAFLADRQLRGVAAGLRAGNPWEAMTRMATWIYDRVHRPGIANPQVQEALARRLFATVSRKSARELRDQLNALEAQGNQMHPELRDWMARVLAVEAGLDEPSGEVAAAADAPSQEAVTQFYQNMRDAANAPEGTTMNVEQDGVESTIVQAADGRFYVGARGFDTLPEAQAYDRYIAAQGQ